MNQPLRVGQKVRSAFALEYLAGEDNAGSPVEGVEFLMASEGSVLLFSGTDWTLRTSEGGWPKLPDWCWPAELWKRSTIEGVGSLGFDEIVGVSEVLNSVGELSGLRLEFPMAYLTVRSGEVMTWDISRKEPR
ncbi:hypothetical protein [Streptomyces sp. NPDC018045]|uniref:hypothetical protein n=1 Tax=Streptomyces sp. NPDC018045 TaxID=3365037 RepID=UPI003798E531